MNATTRTFSGSHAFSANRPVAPLGMGTVAVGAAPLAARGTGRRPRAAQYAECENKVLCGVDLWMPPRYPEEVIAEDEHTITTRTDRGVLQRTLKSPDEMSMPEHIAYPVQSRADWEALKRRFDPADPARFPTGWSQQCAQWREEGPILVFQGPRSPSLFGFVRELMGPERTLYAFHDDPLLVHDMMEVSTELVLGVLPPSPR